MDIRQIAKQLVAEGKGVFAADAGQKSIGKKLADLGVAGDTPEARRRYREVLFTVPGLGKYVSGVIMHDESIRQETKDGVKFVDVLIKENILPGIKVDLGLVDLPNFADEKITEGLDGLRERLKSYYEMGARFTKWRMVVVIDDRRPSRPVVEANAQVLARYAALSQEAGMVPIVEPEVLMDGVHTIERNAEVTEMVGRIVFETLLEHKVDMQGLIYKTNMVIMGKTCPVQASDEEIAKKTVEVLKKTVSVGVPGVVFLSGGQEAVAATRRLNEIVRVGAGTPWKWTFSFERAFEEPTMKVWLGKDENVAAAQAVLLKRAELNSLASLGRYAGE